MTLIDRIEELKKRHDNAIYFRSTAEQSAVAREARDLLFEVLPLLRECEAALYQASCLSNQWMRYTATPQPECEPLRNKAMANINDIEKQIGAVLSKLRGAT